MNTSFSELLNEIVIDFKQIHINIKNNKFKEIDVFSKISELLRLAEEVENYTPENISCLGNLFSIANIYFCYYNEEKSENLKQLEYYYYKWGTENYQDEFKLFLKNNSDNYDEMGYYIYDLDEYDIFLFEKQYSHILNSSSTTKETKLNTIGRETSLAEQIKLLKDIGVIKFCLDDKRISKVKLAEILSIILNRSEQNVRSFITYYNSEEKNIPPRQKKYFLDTPNNIDFSNNILNKGKGK